MRALCCALLLCAGCSRSGFAPPAGEADAPRPADLAAPDAQDARPAPDVQDAQPAADAFSVVAGTVGAVSLEPAPASTELNAWESNAHVRLFPERSQVPLAADLKVTIDAPGGHNEFSGLPGGTVIQGTRVTSYLLHADNVGTTDHVVLAGTVSFNVDILAVIARHEELAGSDAALGAPGTVYPSTEYRGVDDIEDTVAISADRRSLTVVFTIDIHLDQVRVVLAAP